MSITTEIQRLQQAKSNLKTAIESMGVTVPASAKISQYHTYVSQIQSSVSTSNWILDIKKSSVNVELTEQQASELSSMSAIARGAYYLLSFSKLSGHINLSMSSASGSYSFAGAFVSTKVSIVSVLNLTSVTGAYTFENAFANCADLKTFNVNPLALQYYDAGVNVISSATLVENLTLSNIVNSNIYIIWQRKLNSTSVLHVLNKLSSTVSGKTCAFASINISSTDANYTNIENRLQELDNWRITGLTLSR